ncbi:MAG: hypothetical protein NT051_06045 [Candidatus Micrarchaeota archaeon]|nr:hypothetical protein [Candidatus Micrarchaeota archaeon]
MVLKIVDGKGIRVPGSAIPEAQRKINWIAGQPAVFLLFYFLFPLAEGA